MFIVEVVATNRVVTKVLRTTDYDLALSVFDYRKKTKVREVRLVRVTYGIRAVLKYLDRSRRA